MELGAITPTAAYRNTTVPARRQEAEALAECLAPAASEYDRLCLSKDARERAELERAQAELSRQRTERAERRAAMADALAQFREPTPTGDNMGKCVQIAGRIMGGDRVPQSDEEFLLHNAPQLYQQAILMRQAGGEESENYESSHSPSVEAAPMEPRAVAGNGGNLRDPQGVKVPWAVPPPFSVFPKSLHQSKQLEPRPAIGRGFCHITEVFSLQATKQSRRWR